MRVPKTSSRKAGLWALTAALAAVALSGCVGGAEANSNLFVKDALTDDVDAVHVTFTKAQAKHADGGWVTVFQGVETIELLSLSSADAKAQLAAFDLAPGTYDGLRIAVSEVEVTQKDGTQVLLNVFGNVVTVADEFTVGADGIDILIDFDLDAGVDLASGTYTPIVKAVQTSDDDADGDGIHDVDDTDDDNDGKDDAEDDDDDGDGRDDRPEQRHDESEEAACRADRDEEMEDAREDRDEERAEAEQERDEELARANSSAEREQAWDDYNATVSEADAEYDEDVAEASEEHDECLREEDEGDGQDGPDGDSDDQDGQDDDGDSDGERSDDDGSQGGRDDSGEDEEETEDGSEEP